MKIMEKIKNEEKLSNALPISINYAVYVLHNEHNAYSRA